MEVLPEEGGALRIWRRRLSVMRRMAGRGGGEPEAAQERKSGRPEQPGQAGQPDVQPAQAAQPSVQPAQAAQPSVQPAQPGQAAQPSVQPAQPRAARAPPSPASSPRSPEILASPPGRTPPPVPADRDAEKRTNSSSLLLRPGRWCLGSPYLCSSRKEMAAGETAAEEAEE